MGFFDLMGRWFSNDNGTISDCYIYELSIENYYKKLAIDTSINLIANALVRSKFHTFEKGKKKRGNTFYLFNVSPNVNQNATEFIHKLVSNLVYENEALAIMQNDELYIADSWSVTEFALKENIYTGVTVGDLTFDKSFTEKDILHYKLNNKNIVEVINGLYSSYGKLLAAGMNSYKRGNAMRAIVEIDSTVSFTDKDQAARDDLFNNQFKSFFNSEGGAVLPLQKGLKYTGVNSTSGNTSSSRDVRAIVDDVLDLVSMALHVPKGLLKGDLADVEGQVDIFLMFGVNPIAELLNDENNRKMYTKEEYLERTYMLVDTSMIKYVDPTKMAIALDKMLSSGLTSINDNRERMGLEPINESWANEHFITKNYQEVSDYLANGPNQGQPLKGGESE